MSNALTASGVELARELAAAGVGAMTLYMRRPGEVAASSVRHWVRETEKGWVIHFTMPGSDDSPTFGTFLVTPTGVWDPVRVFGGRHPPSLNRVPRRSSRDRGIPRSGRWVKTERPLYWKTEAGITHARAYLERHGTLPLDGDQLHAGLD